MAKLYTLTAVCIFSMMFLVLQMMNYGSLNGWEALMPIKLQTREMHGKQIFPDAKNAHKTLTEFQDICTILQVDCILIDPGVLVHLTEDPNDSKELHTTAHKNCHYFCGRSLFIFASLAPNLLKDDKMDIFLEKLGKSGFKSTVLKGKDDRSLSLEVVFNQKDLTTHIILEKRAVFIHIVLLYERLNNYWSTTCSLVAPKRFSRFPKALMGNKFFVHQNLMAKFTWMTVKLENLKITIPKYPVTFLRNLRHSQFTACNMKQARQFVSRYGFELGTEADVFRLRAKNLLFTVKYVLDRLGIRFWLSSGTCLGWFRQCDFIPHSKDLDIGIFIKEYSPKISQELQNAGLVPKHIFGKVEDSYELSFRTASNDLKLDIFFFYEEVDYMWNGGTQARTGKKFKYRFPKFDLCWTEFVELLVRVPCNTLAYIEANYGPNWNALIKEWDWKKSPSNVKENGVWPKSELKDVVQVFQ
eukprot:gene5995-6691_t